LCQDCEEENFIKGDHPHDFIKIRNEQINDNKKSFVNNNNNNILINNDIPYNNKFKKSLQNNNAFNNNIQNNNNSFNNNNTNNNKLNFNPLNDMNLTNQIQNQNLNTINEKIPAKFFVIKSIDEANIIRSINFKIWCSTIKGNQKLQKAFKESEKKYPIYLFFSVNGSGKFMGVAQMVSEVEYRVNFNYWSQNDKWKGFFFVNWIFIKDIPNRIFRQIINEYNDNKPVTSSRDTQEIFPTAGMKMLKIFKEYPQESSIFDNMSIDEKLLMYQQQNQQNQNSQNNQIGNMNNLNFGNMGMNMGMVNNNFGNGNFNNFNFGKMNLNQQQQMMMMIQQRQQQQRFINNSNINNNNNIQDSDF
jgi:hypothetical protein